MTRPFRLLQAEREDSIVVEVKKFITPENTIKYKIYKIVHESKKPLLLREIIQKGNLLTTRRTCEKAVTDLYTNKHISRVECPCGNTFIYSK